MTLKKIILPIFLSIGTIFAFIVSVIKPNQDSVTKPNLSSTNSESSKQQHKDKTISHTEQFQKLSVLPLRCIGCGKCARVDALHFEMNYTTGKAIVISSTNLNSQNLAAAINICPVQAITLN